MTPRTDIFADTASGDCWAGYRHVVFDCDSTLTRIEGIDELNTTENVHSEIAGLTDAAMNGQQSLEDVYDRRLDLLTPTRGEVIDLARKYRRNMVDDAEQVVQALLQGGIEVYIVSGGLQEPVERFGVSIGVPLHHIRAVPLHYDELSGDWWRQDDPGNGKAMKYYRTGRSRLTTSDGKQDVITSLLAGSAGRSMLVGDGISDLRAADVVDTFVGFGGVVSRGVVESLAPVFIDAPTLLPILPLALGSRLFAQLDPVLVDAATRACERYDVSFRNEKLKDSFYSCLSARR